MPRVIRMGVNKQWQKNHKAKISQNNRQRNRRLRLLGVLGCFGVLAFTGCKQLEKEAEREVQIQQEEDFDSEVIQQEELKVSEDERINFHNELFGENVYLFSPQDDPQKVQQVLDDLWERQETNQFGRERYAVYFLPGQYDESLKVKVGYYMQVAGLGLSPEDTSITELQCDATWLGDDSNHNATCNFWRGVENLQITSNTMWAVSQATFMRRVHIIGSLYLHDNYGWASGGFLADSKIDYLVESGSQQQWLSRNCDWKAWMGQNWNMVFAGIKEGKAPTGTWPGMAYTTVETVEKMQEKPFLMYDETKGYGVFLPAIRTNSKGVSWDGQEDVAGRFIPIQDCYIAKPEIDDADTLNEALGMGKTLIFTPGIYELSKALNVTQEGQIILGMGLATLQPLNGNECIKISSEGAILAGILFDAGINTSEVLLQVGEKTTKKSEEVSGLISLSDLFFRVGGSEKEAVSVLACVEINESHVVGDNFWVWRADHGDMVAWDKNTAKNGIIVNGDNVTIYALMVEHFQEYQTIWNGENGKVIMYQSEIPYDIPNQEIWLSHEGTKNGYASYYIADTVLNHEAWGLGIYSYNRDATVELYSAMEAPEIETIRIHNICTVMLAGNPGITHVVNEEGDSCYYAGARAIITEFPSTK